MSEPTPVEFLADPLSAITRSERRNLLFASIAGILLAKAGLVPTQIAAFGIVLSVPEQSTFLVIVALIVLYFLGAFIVYGLADFFILRKKYQDYLEHVDTYMESWSLEDQRAYDERRSRVPDIAWLYRGSKPVALARVLFEYAVPILVGLYAAVVLLLGVQRP